MDGILAHLVASLPADEPEPPWPETPFGQSVEPCTVQHGVAGPLAVFARLGALDPSRASTCSTLIQATLPRLLDHVRTHRHLLPGLYFGSAGTAWVMHDLGLALDREDLRDRGCEMALQLPVEWPNADVTHGLSGLGSCLLHLAAATGRGDLHERASTCADSVLGAAQHDSDGIYWSVPPSFDSLLAGYRSLGFAHGLPGVGCFLLAAGQAVHRGDLQDAAIECGETLLRHMLRTSDGYMWPATLTEGRPLTYWCNGAAGVGTFLCRLFTATGDERFEEAAIGAARAVVATRWWVGNCSCHGISGAGDFLLDLAAATDDPLYRQWANEIVELLWARRVHVGGRAVLTDESGKAITGGYGAGLAGCLAFLTRTRFSGERLFHPPIGTSHACA